LVKTCVIDASVPMKWYVDDEECIDSARQLLHDYGSGRITIIAPEFFFVEVGNALNVVVRRERMKEKEASRFLQNILELNIITVPSLSLLVSAWKISRLYGCSVYDSIYIAGAYDLSCNLYTGDRKFYNILKDKLSLIKWIGDYDRLKA
jgi:predicted nucleic acid-binding protein